MSQVKNPALWPDETSNVMYSWSGEGFTAASNIHLWKFTPDGKGNGSWAEYGAPDKGIRPGTAGSSTVCAGRGFLLGGYGSFNTDTWYRDNIPQPGLLLYDLAAGAWDNVTAPLPYARSRLGQAACLPFGAEGVVSFFGGAKMAPTSVSTLEYISFENITFYDPSAKQWLWQTTTGDIPKERMRYCSVGAAGPNGTYDM